MGKNMVVRIIFVTPAMAKKWLEASTDCNRNLSEPTVRFYAAEMQAGRWRTTNDAIVLNTNEKVINGQHRLTALIRADIGAYFVVVEGADDKDKEVYDQGRARSVPDMLKMIYGVKRASLITGAIRIIDDFVYDNRLKLSVGHAWEMITKFDEAIRWAVDMVPGKSTLGSSAVVGALIFAHKTAPTTVDMFARRFFTGADLGLTSPIRVAREQVTREGSLIYRDQKHDVFRVVLHAIYKTMHNEQVRSKSIRVREDLTDYFGEVHRQKSKRKVA